MKKGILFCALSICSVYYSQSTVKNFYVVEKSNTSISPILASKASNNQLSLTFNEDALQNFFSTKNVLKYEKAFTGTKSELLKRTYFVSISTDEANLLTQLKNLPSVDFVEEIPEVGLLHYPNDIDINNTGNDRALELVRAPLAWEITKGSPNVLVGVADTGFNINHEELSSKIVQHIGTVTPSGGHGTLVSGFVGADTNNGIGVASIGYNTKLVTGSGHTMMVHQMAQIPNVRVINTSWVSTCYYSAIDAETYREVWEDFGVVVVSAAGNGSTCGGPNNYVYPSAYENHTIAVSSVGTSFPIGTIYTDGNGVDHQIEWNDVHQNGINPLNPDAGTHQHNDRIDLVAPGYAIPNGIKGVNQYEKCWGTSCASPQVAAAAALILSVNPTLTPNEVKKILKKTTDDIYWIPYNQPYIGKLGTGRLNVFRAVKETKCINEANPKIDFMIKDSKEDVGEQPNNRTQYMWTSSDIFVRNNNDGKLIPVHQNPVYNAINPNYIYVRVTNMGCQTSSGTDTVSVNWAKANTSLNYPEYWDGSVVQNGVVFGGLVGTGTIPTLRPGQEALVEIPWHVPNPQNYSSINSEPWHFCLLAQVNSSDDPLTSPMTPNPNIMVRNNNNLAWKNITVINVSDGGDIGGTIAVTNPHAVAKNYYLELVKEDVETGNAIYEEAEVTLTMDTPLLNAWKRGGSISNNLQATQVEEKKVVKANNVILDDINLNANEMGTLYVSFNFLSQKATDKEKYRYHVIQRDSETGEIMGGETFEVQKKSRPNFIAEPVSASIAAKKNESVTIGAKDINELAVYNWYDENDNLVHTGKSFEVSLSATKKFKLEVIALDGFKDYSEVEVKINPYKFINMSPNPATSEVVVRYDIENSSSAHIVVAGITNTSIYNNYILNTATSQKEINLTNYPKGQYTVALVVDGKIVESKNLTKN